MTIGEGLQVECINLSYSWHCDLRNQHIFQWGLSLTAINLAQDIWPRIPEKCVCVRLKLSRDPWTRAVVPVLLRLKMRWGPWTRAVAPVLFSWADTAAVAGACVVCTICSLWSVVDSHWWESSAATNIWCRSNCPVIYIWINLSSSTCVYKGKDGNLAMSCATASDCDARSHRVLRVDTAQRDDGIRKSWAIYGARFQHKNYGPRLL